MEVIAVRHIWNRSLFLILEADHAENNTLSCTGGHLSAHAIS